MSNQYDEDEGLISIAIFGLILAIILGYITGGL